uniref:Secreted protein n=1 Tax=uncultured bacterium HF186_25m_13D19 TaxID=662888 RepID=C7FPG0_9BACT|nr:secreted protein [uncultured bacterium HF186_25m_13D19]
MRSPMLHPLYHAALMALSAALTVGLSGCHEAPTSVTESLLSEGASADRMSWMATASLGASSSCDHALSQLQDNARTEMLLQAEQVRRQMIDGEGMGMWLDRGVAEDVALVESAEPSAAPGGASGSSPNDVSHTNVQVAGVDEADRVKTDAEYLYTISGNDLVIIAAWPADDMVEVSRITVAGSPHGLYLHDDHVVVLSSSYRGELRETGSSSEERGGEDWHRWQSLTLVTTVDIANPASPRITDAQAFEGDLSATRRIGSDVYLVQNTWTYIDGLQYWPDVDWDAPLQVQLSALNEMVQRNLRRIDALTLDDFLPYRFTLSEDGEVDLSSQAFSADCQHVYLPSAHSGANLTTVVTLNLETTEAFGTAVPGTWGEVYASADAMYIASTNWGYAWYWMTDDEAPRVMSHIHKFDISPTSGRAAYVASGSVPGYVLNQFSMDEYQGALRVATTEPSAWGWWGDDEESESRVSVLGEASGALVELGHVGGLGKGERIYSVRFMGERGYVVTFRQVDPLYVLDLSKPSAPRVTGELKIPGFSSYMHPLGEDHLLTIGRDATDEGVVQGLQFQIFDVSDPTQPTLAQKTVLGDGWNTWSEAQYDHHAFNYFGARGLLALPVSGWEYDEGQEQDWGYYGRYVSKLQLFEVDVQSGVTPTGAITHDSLADAYQGYGACGDRDAYGWEAQIRRSVFMDDIVYTISDLGVRADDIRDLASGEIAQVLTLHQDHNPAHANGCD